MQYGTWLYKSAGHLGTVEEQGGWRISYNNPLSSSASFTLPTLWLSGLPASLAAIFVLTEPLPVGFSSTVASSSAFLFSSPLYIFLKVIIGTLAILFRIVVWREWNWASVGWTAYARREDWEDYLCVLCAKSFQLLIYDCLTPCWCKQMFTPIKTDREYDCEASARMFL